MARKTFRVNGNFPVQQQQLTETVEAGTWMAALGAAARKFKQTLKGRRITAASFMIEQVQLAAEPGPAPVQASLPQAVEEAAPVAAPEPVAEPAEPNEVISES